MSTGSKDKLDVLLTLSRTEKIDLRKISVLEMAHQYLTFAERAKTPWIELAADYLVMAAWLAFLKSRLLLPQSRWNRGCASGRLISNSYRSCAMPRRA